MSVSEQDIVEQLENICPACGKEFDAVEFGAPGTWLPHGHVGGDEICEDFSHEACFYHGVDEAIIEEFCLVPAVDIEAVESFDDEFQTADELGDGR